MSSAYTEAARATLANPRTVGKGRRIVEERKDQKRPYETPKLTVLGSVESITAAKSSGAEDAKNTNPPGVAP